VQSVRFVSFSIFSSNAFAVDGCPLTSIVPSLPLIDLVYFTEDTNATPAWVQRVLVDF
jgi:hypothetical protein